ncbi:MAG: caspase family protein [Microscillaceae bacterium]|nr:caspase family protein [Microscillaceae bacterium]MDW8460522.1 caspase family protein [Cytophagales bacterium]
MPKLRLVIFVIGVSLLACQSSWGQNVKEFIENGRRKLSLEGAKPLRQAIIDFRQALSIAPHNEEALYYLADSYYREGNADSASYFIAKAIEINPLLSANYHLKALIESSLKEDYRASIDSYTKAIQLASADERLYAERAWTYLKVGDIKKAEQDVNSSLRCLNKNAIAIFVSNLVYFYKATAKQEKETALAGLLNTIILIRDEQIAYRDYLSNCYLELGNAYAQLAAKESAIEYYRIACKINPQQYKAYVYGAVQNMREPSPNYNIAYEQVDKVIKQQSRNVTALLLRSLINQKRQDLQQAQKDFEKFKSLLATKREHEKVEIVELITEFAETAEYFEIAEQITQNFSQEKTEYDWLKAKIAFKRNELDEAQRLAKKVLASADRTREKTLIENAQKLLYKIDAQKVDNIPPSIESLLVMNKEIDNPQETMRGIITIPKTETLTVSGIVRDENGIEKIMVNNLRATYFSHNGRFQATLALPVNTTQFDLYIEVYDKKGNVAKSHRKIIISTQADPPVVKNAEPDYVPIPILAQKENLGKTYVLIIAEKDYKHWDRLKNPIKDAYDLAQLYRELYGYEVKVLENPTRKDILKTLRDDYMQRTYSPEDQLLIHLAGHGHHDEKVKQGYFVPIEGLTPAEDPFGETLIHLSTLRNWIDNINCKHILVSLDFCYSGTFDELIASRGTETVEYKGIKGLENIKRKKKLKTRLYIASAEKEQVPDGRDGQNSPFIRKWLYALREAYDMQEVLTTRKIFKYLEDLKPRPCMGEFSSGSNEPGSDFFFIPKPK